MKARKSLWSFVLVASCLALSAEAPLSTLGHVRDSSFSIDVPMGWKVVEGGGSNHVFSLVPNSPTENGSAPQLTFAYYTKEMLLGGNAKNRFIAANRLVDPDAKLVELPYIQGLGAWTFLERVGGKGGRTDVTAYTNIGLDILWVSLSAPEGEPYLRSKERLLQVLRSYREKSVSLD